MPRARGNVVKHSPLRLPAAIERGHRGHGFEIPEKSVSQHAPAVFDLRDFDRVVDIGNHRQPCGTGEERPAFKAARVAWPENGLKRKRLAIARGVARQFKNSFEMAIGSRTFEGMN